MIIFQFKTTYIALYSPNSHSKFQWKSRGLQEVKKIKPACNYLSLNDILWHITWWHLMSCYWKFPNLMSRYSMVRQTDLSVCLFVNLLVSEFMLKILYDAANTFFYLCFRTYSQFFYIILFVCLGFNFLAIQIASMALNI